MQLSEPDSYDRIQNKKTVVHGRLKFKGEF